MALTNVFSDTRINELCISPKEEIPMGGYMVKPIERISVGMRYPYLEFGVKHNRLIEVIDQLS